MITVKPVILQRKKSFFDLDNSLNFNNTQGCNIDNLDTGDLVFVAYENTLGYFMRGYTGSAWTHVGMIMKYKDEVYVMETADYSLSSLLSEKSVKSPNIYKNIQNWKHAKKSGVMVIPFELWKSLNKKHTITCKKLQTPENFDKRVLIREFLEIQEENLDTFEVGGCNLRLWNKFLSRKPYSKHIPKSNITCSEMIARIYQSGSIIKKSFDPGSYYTKDFIEGSIEMEPGFQFI
jgi:hypothetical protein